MRFLALSLLSVSLLLSSPATAGGGRGEVPTQASKGLGNVFLISVGQRDAGEVARILQDKLKETSPQSKLVSLAWRSKPDAYEMKAQIDRLALLLSPEPVGALYLNLSSGQYSADEVQAILSAFWGKATPQFRVFINGLTTYPSESTWQAVAQRIGVSELRLFQAARRLGLADLKRSVPKSRSRLKIRVASLTNSALHAAGFLALPLVYEAFKADPLSKTFLLSLSGAAIFISVIADATLVTTVQEQLNRLEKQADYDGLEYQVREEEPTRDGSGNSTLFIRDVLLSPTLPCEKSLARSDTFNHFELD